MQEQLLDLLEYREVLTAVASTHDGLVVSTAGLGGEEAEVVAAAGAALLDASDQDVRYLTVDVDGGRLHLTRGPELVLVVLSGIEVDSDQLQPILGETLELIEQHLAQETSQE